MGWVGGILPSLWIRKNAPINCFVTQPTFLLNYSSLHLKYAVLQAGPSYNNSSRLATYTYHGDLLQEIGGKTGHSLISNNLGQASGWTSTSLFRETIADWVFLLISVLFFREETLEVVSLRCPPVAGLLPEAVPDYCQHSCIPATTRVPTPKGGTSRDANTNTGRVVSQQFKTTHYRREITCRVGAIQGATSQLGVESRSRGK